MAPRHRSRQTLGQGLDREVYQVVRKIVDERSQFGEPPSHLSFAIVYDEIRRSNSSLNRKPKQLLENSVERVLATIQQDSVDSDTEGDMDGAAEQVGSPLESNVRLPTNGLNRSIAAAWSAASSGAPPASGSRREQEQDKNAIEQEPTSKRRQVNGEPLAKRRKGAPAIDRSPPTHISLAQMGGVGPIIKQFKKLLVLPMMRPEVYANAKIQPPRGVLIYGPPGCGKTMIAHAFAAELGVNFISISAPSIVSGMSGESEKALRDHFEEAKKCAPCLMFIDEIDAITPKREGAQREMEKRIVAQLLTCMDDLAMEKTDNKPVIVLAATNRPDSLDAALRRGGRFDKEINMSVPSEPVREQILRALTRETPMDADVDLAMLARRTPGFVGADLNDLVATAGATAIERVLDILEADARSTTMELDEGNEMLDPELPPLRGLIRYTREHPVVSTSEIIESVSNTNEVSSSNLEIRLTASDFLLSLPQIQPSALREGFATIPSTTFSSIGALDTHISELQSTIIQPITHPTFYSDLGITPSSGALLWGPPGCGKTLLAKAAANSSHANFISVKGPELLNKYVGESERAVRQVFQRARSSVPCIIFFDELDALVPRRDGTMSEASARVVNTLLTELDGVGQSREGIYIIAATNRPDIIDPAMLRPGRLDTLLFVGLPDAEGRVDILRTLCKNLKNFVWREEIADVARRCDGFSGADLESLLKNAGYAAVKRLEAGGLLGSGSIADGSIGNVISQSSGQSAGEASMGITLVDFEAAALKVHRSVTVDEMTRYDLLQNEWGKSG